VSKKEGLTSPNDEIQITVNLPLQVQMALKIMATDYFKSNGKKRVGLSTYVRSILCDHVFKKYPDLKNSLIQAQKLKESVNKC